MRTADNIKIISYATTVITVAALSLTSCVKEDPYDTPHPDKGKVTVMADWSSLGEGVAIPSLWRAVIGDYAADETGTTHEAQQLFEPGDYRLTAYNHADGITVTGTTATVSAVSGAARGKSNTIISGTPDWFFACVQDITIEKDREHLFTATMRQQIRQLTLIVDIPGDTAPEIESIVGYFSGAAATLDFASGNYGCTSDIELNFTKIVQGTDIGKWKASVRLLGITGDMQRLSATVTFAGGDPGPLPIDSDLSAPLAGFNSDKTAPLVLAAPMVGTPGHAGITATIGNWKEVDIGNIDAY